jgi:YD repeat-containing protein
MVTKPPFSSPVKEYQMESYIIDENNQEALDSRVIWRYNEHNKVSEAWNYNSNNELSEISYYTYDEDQNLREIRVEAADGGEKQRFVYEYKNNKLSQITEITPEFKIVTKYDDYGNSLEKQTFGGEEAPFSTTKYINLYDNDGRLIEKHTVFPEGTPDKVYKYKYDSQGLLIEEQQIRNQITSIVKNGYNDKGDLIWSEYNPGEINSESLKKDITYNENNDIVEIKEYRKGWCYQDRNDEFGLTCIIRYSYTR